jgi:hypothetical protein
MIVALSIVCVVQALALGAVALRAVWPAGCEDSAPLDVAGGVVQQDSDEDETVGRVGFRHTPEA